MQTLTPAETQTRLAAMPPALYLDVRTVAEFAKGRPKGNAVNVPWSFTHPTTREILLNASFRLVIEALYPKDAELIVGSQTGSRGDAAAATLVTAGYLNVAVLKGGFEAWRAAGLMTTTDNRPGISYVSLLTRVKRPPNKKASGGH
ncbi:MAG: rhodanese-like domain-containing protein [Gammaproteobacteria bacterium]|nr:rhodanese-like domain-containing protein [Gammaproteobacteria bacterium]